MAHVQGWLGKQVVSLLPVRTAAATSASEEYAQTRAFHRPAGYRPLEVFPNLWDAHNPALPLVKLLPVG